MKKLFTLIAIALAVMVSSCSKFDDSAIWDKLNEQEQTLNDHEKRIAALEELCKQLNTNINALQTIVEALEKKDYVTNVSPVREDGEIVGYTISFANSDTITIYNGKDGKDGYTPQIGVMKDTDGIYYWTLDGEWLLDGKGSKIQANGVNGIDGTDGSNGEDGTNGVDGITPRLKIENDYWYVSYDEGATWIELGKATGEDGSDGADGNSIFTSVTQDDEFVYFNLADGTIITLPKHDNEHIQFEDFNVKVLCCKLWDTNNDGELSYTEASAVTDIGTNFKGNSSIVAFKELQYFTGINTIPQNAFKECSKLWKIHIPNSVTTIEYQAFMDCGALSVISIPNSVTSIEKSAFESCGFQTLTLPNGLTIIADGTFQSCYKLTNINIPDSVTTIGNYAFSSCKLSKLVIPDSVIEIGSGAFGSSSSLRELTIGKNVQSIGALAFAASNLVYIYCKADIPPALYWTANVSSGNPSIYDENSALIIYVPRSAYNEYVSYSSRKNGLYKDNWCMYKSRISPYDF